jgi:protein TonB
LAEGVSWNCPFPAEADESGIDGAVVGLAIEVDANGDVINVTVERDPGAGFGRAAAACARSKRFSPAEDRDGKPIVGRSRVNVRFHR